MKEVKHYSHRTAFSVFAVLVYFIIIYLLTYLTDDTLGRVFTGMLPSFIWLVCLFYIDPNKKKNRLMVSLAPLLISFAFLVIWKFGIFSALSRMEGPTLSILNMFLGYFMILFFVEWNHEEESSGEESGSTDKVDASAAKKDIRVPEDLFRSVDDDNADHKTSKLSRDFGKLRKSFDQYRQKADSESGEIVRLRRAVAAFEHEKNRDVGSLINLRDSVARHKIKTVDDLDDIKELRAVAERIIAPAKRLHARKNERIVVREDVSEELVNLRKIIELYEQKSNVDAVELSRLRKTLAEYIHELHVTKQNMATTFRSIEDKCKAINFVIGRVYSDKKGGSAEIRERINIPREWYNTFSEVLADPRKEKFQGFLKVLEQLLERLDELEKKERRVIRIKKQVAGIKRSADDSVLSVLEKNDKDPIREYHAEAKEICGKIAEFVKEELGTK